MIARRCGTARSTPLPTSPCPGGGASTSPPSPSFSLPLQEGGESAGWRVPLFSRPLAGGGPGWGSRQLQTGQKDDGSDRTVARRSWSGHGSAAMTEEPNGRLHLPSLSIRGFRGIGGLDIPRLGRVTLIAGKNDGGTSGPAPSCTRNPSSKPQPSRASRSVKAGVTWTSRAISCSSRDKTTGMSFGTFGIGVIGRSRRSTSGPGRDEPASRPAAPTARSLGR